MNELFRQHIEALHPAYERLVNGTSFKFDHPPNLRAKRPLLPAAVKGKLASTGCNQS